MLSEGRFFDVGIGTCEGYGGDVAGDRYGGEAILRVEVIPFRDVGFVPSSQAGILLR